MAYILAYDIGTTGVKTCLFEIVTGNATAESKIRMMADASADYGLYTFDDGGAEQHADEWWDAMKISTRVLLEKTDVDIDGISFCSQMQGLVLVDENGVPVRHPMSYMDQRAGAEMRSGIGGGLKIAGMNVHKLLKSLKITGAVSGSVKDPMWKYLWVKTHEPEDFKRVRWWLDVKEYLISRMTGNFVMTRDSAFATLMFDSRDGKECWSSELCRMFGVEERHLPKIIKTHEQAGFLREQQAGELGLKAGIPVFGGGGDASLLGVGSGCTHTGDTHIYWGTSGWVSTITDKRVVDTNTMIASIVGAQPGKFNYFAEMETAGKCLEWVKDHLAIDEIGIYLEKKDVTQNRNGVGKVYKTLYEYLTDVIDSAQSGSGGVIFTPWLHGNRCPFEDPNAAGMFFNIRLETGKTEMIRAVVEGVCYHLRWMLECEDKKVNTSETIRFCGGGALSPATSQILADITGRRIETVPEPQNAGSVGAAITAAVGLGEAGSIEELSEMVKPDQVFEPRNEYRELHDRNFDTFKKLYVSNKKNYAALNG